MLTLHIGLPKTGSTYLQQNILARVPDVLLVHRSQGAEADAICMDLRRYVRANRVHAAWLRRRIRPRLQALAGQAAHERRALVISAENISVHAIDFWRGTDPTPEQVARRLADLAGRDGALAPVRVVIGLRRQDQWLASRYAESGKDLPRLSQADFDRRLTAIAGSHQLTGGMAWLDHHQIYTAFAAVLGPEHVHLYWLERLAAQPVRTLARIGRFIGGKAVGDALRGVARAARPKRRNVLSLGENVWRLKSDRSELRLTPELAAAVEARFRDSNSALAAVLDRGGRTPPSRC